MKCENCKEKCLGFIHGTIKKCDFCENYFLRVDMYDCYGEGWICEKCLTGICDNAWKTALEIFGGQQKLDKYLKEVKVS